MGSFAELVMSFPMRADVEEEVLAAFSSIARPAQDAPPLPDPVQDPEPYALEWLAESGGSPWEHNWGEFLASPMTNVYIPSDKVAVMTWAHRRWVVTVRTSLKTSSEGVIEIVKFLGPIIDAEGAPAYRDYDVRGTDLSTEPRLFIGYAQHEYEPRPWLLWADGTQVHAENLNPPGFDI